MTDKSVAFSDKQIGSWLAGLLVAYGRFTVSDDGNFYVAVVNEDDTLTPMVIGNSDGTAQNVVLFGSKAPATTSILINPFSEDVTKKYRSYFCSMLNSNINTTMIAMINELMKIALTPEEKPAPKTKAKGKKTKADAEDPKPTSTINRKALPYLGDVAHEIDDKMIAEFKSICSDKALGSILMTYYDHKKHIARITSRLYSPQHDSFPNVRVKTWKVLNTLISNILKTENVEDFDTEPLCADLLAIFDSTVSLYIKLSEVLKEPAKDILGLDIKGIDEMKDGYTYIKQYHARAKYIAQSAKLEAESKKLDSAKSNLSIIDAVAGSAPASETTGSISLIEAMDNARQAAHCQMYGQTAAPVLAQQPVGVAPSITTRSDGSVSILDMVG